jgi:hypothetical protein
MLLVAVLLAAQSVSPSTVSSDDVTDAEPELPRTWLWPGAAMASRLGSGGQAAVQLALSFRLTPFVEPEALMSFGGYLDPAQMAHFPTGFEIVDRFSFGTRLLWPISNVRPFVWLALRHEHQAASAAWLSAPIPTTLGFSETGVVHKTGAELAVGTDLLAFVDDNPMLASIRVGVVALPSFGSYAHGDQVGLFADVAAGLPLSL